jgi:hypothetical protein
MFIIRKSVQAALRYFIMHLYKQSSPWLDVTGIKHILSATYDTIHTELYSEKKGADYLLDT